MFKAIVRGADFALLRSLWLPVSYTYLLAPYEGTVAPDYCMGLSANAVAPVLCIDHQNIMSSLSGTPPCRFRQYFSFTLTRHGYGFSDRPWLSPTLENRDHEFSPPSLSTRDGRLNLMSLSLRIWNSRLQLSVP